MIVAELISLLETVDDKTKEVYTQGCDCWGVPIGTMLIKLHYGDEKTIVLITTKS